MKDRNTWNMSVEQLLHAAAGGGKASEYFKSGTKGWDYHQYLMLFLMLTPTEKKIIRMTQLIENNVWLMKGYENFQLKNCAVKASFSGKIDVTPLFLEISAEDTVSFSYRIYLLILRKGGEEECSFFYKSHTLIFSYTGHFKKNI